MGKQVNRIQEFSSELSNRKTLYVKSQNAERRKQDESG